ncbi:MAG: BMP family ABC transporter substrate-binding protein [Erysipelotrichaceae bacterium]|nr:BMP family ABC transporter substrate-binding protein [Erysipelotrichaceae bacterium]
MKKLLAILLALLMVLSFAGCTKTPDDKPQDDGGLKIAYIVGHLGDKSFSDSGERGMETLRSEGYDVRTVEVGEDASKFKDQINDVIDNGYNLILASSTYFDVAKELAQEYPDVKFVIFEDSKDPADLLPNIAVIFYAQSEGSYLVGYMAAGMSKTGTVAVNVGKINPVINDFVTGYVNGVLDYNAAHGTNVKVVTAACDSWSDPATMKQICLDQQRNLNADVFYQVAGGSGDGLFEACVETGTWAIGVDSDQYQAYKDSQNPEKADVILTSMLKEVGNSLIAIVHSIDKGEDVFGKTNTLGLVEQAVGYVDNDFFKANVPQELRDEMAKAFEDAKAGTLTVKSYFDFASDAEYDAYLNSAK